jgi:hypothetical protein
MNRPTPGAVSPFVRTTVDGIDGGGNAAPMPAGGEWPPMSNLVVAALHLRPRRVALPRHRAVASLHGATDALPPLTVDERVLRRTRCRGMSIVASNRAIHVSTAEQRWDRIGWDDVASAAWDAAGQSLILRPWPSDAGSSQPLALPADRALASFARERSAAACLLCVPATITCGHPITVLATRAAGTDPVRWRVYTSPACAHDRAAQLASIDQILTDVRRVAGC